MGENLNIGTMITGTPTDAEWKTLEGEADTNYEVGSSIWDETGWRGNNAGGRLKEAGYDHWVGPNVGATNTFGFTALSGGYERPLGDYSYLRYEAQLWTSTYHSLNSYLFKSFSLSEQPKLSWLTNQSYAISVRCFR